mmetsp:Transcript_164566/g.527893  ORF Transcript_164566/g.527893 Transcript_164566/m.527893 type:complete len:311 (+) Transcript_164566:1466-2398(+)
MVPVVVFPAAAATVPRPARPPASTSLAAQSAAEQAAAAAIAAAANAASLGGADWRAWARKLEKASHRPLPPMVLATSATALGPRPRMLHLAETEAAGRGPAGPHPSSIGCLRPRVRTRLAELSRHQQMLRNTAIPEAVAAKLHAMARTATLAAVAAGVQAPTGTTGASTEVTAAASTAKATTEATIVANTAAIVAATTLATSAATDSTKELTAVECETSRGRLCVQKAAAMGTDATERAAATLGDSSWPLRAGVSHLVATLVEAPAAEGASAVLEMGAVDTFWRARVPRAETESRGRRSAACGVPKRLQA